MSLRAWDSTVRDSDVQLERAIGLLLLPRVLFLLPFDQFQFSPVLREWSALVPQWVYGASGGSVALFLLGASLCKYCYKLRLCAATTAFFYGVVMTTLYFLSNWRAMAAWYFLLFCVLPLIRIGTLSQLLSGREMRRRDSDTQRSDTQRRSG